MADLSDVLEDIVSTIIGEKVEQQLSGPMVNENIQCFIDCANELLRADETMRALWLLDNLPAWRRDNPHPEVVKLKNEVMAKIATASFYATDEGAELQSDPNIHRIMKHTLRGDMILKEVRFLNKCGHTPIFADLAPGEYSFVRLLIDENTHFSYRPIYVNHPSYEHYKQHFEHMIEVYAGASPKIFFACEIIEHLHNVDELRYEMNRHCGMADIVHFSTPLHTFDTSCLDWRNKGALGHLQAFTPTEFFLAIQKLFPEYDLKLFHSQPMHIRGTLKGTKFQIINTAIEVIFK